MSPGFLLSLSHRCKCAWIIEQDCEVMLELLDCTDSLDGFVQPDPELFLGDPEWLGNERATKYRRGGFRAANTGIRLAIITEHGAPLSFRML